MTVKDVFDTALERMLPSVPDRDIIAQQGDTIVFVEVKTRNSRDFADPVTAVNYRLSTLNS